MLSGVSHDLRTPLTRMKLAVSLAEAGADSGGADDEISKDIKQDISGYGGYYPRVPRFRTGGCDRITCARGCCEIGSGT